jgi:hypothetical protein
MFWKQNDTVSLLTQEKELQGWTTKSWTLQGNTPRLSHLGDGRRFNWFIAHEKQGWTWIGPSSILVPISYLPTYLHTSTQFVPYHTYSYVALSANSISLMLSYSDPNNVLSLHCHFMNQGYAMSHYKLNDSDHNNQTLANVWFWYTYLDFCHAAHLDPTSNHFFLALLGVVQKLFFWWRGTTKD